MPKTIYALLVGINDYPTPVPKLSGCVPDVNAVEAYLLGLSGTEVKFEILTDKAATKNKIVAGFRDHLSKAGPDDVAFFYFSGHGTQEDADEVFWQAEPSRRLQSLVCYDGIVKKNGQQQYNLLADKELRYLLHELSETGAHILTVFDCCHSGDTTRGHPIRRLAGASPKRNWEQFIFSDQLPREAFAGQSVADLIPEGQHIQMAACSSKESAFEKDGHGVFTTNLLDFLERTGSFITYYDQQSLLRNFLKNNFKQTPQIYASRSAPDELFHLFLDLNPDSDLIRGGRKSGGRRPGNVLLWGNVIYRPNEGWWLDMGHLHGVSAMAKNVEVTSLDEAETMTARIGKIEASRTELLFDAGATISPEGIYKAAITDFLSALVKVFFNVQTSDPAGLRNIEAVWKTEAGPNLMQAEKEYEADYTLHIAENKYTISWAEDARRLPLVPVLEDFQYQEARQTVAWLHHISRWEFVKNLHNPNSWMFKSHPIEVEFFSVTNAGEAPVALQNDEVVLNYERQADGQFGGRIKIRITNRFHRELHIALLYLSINFGSNGGLLKPKVVNLQPGESAWTFEGKTIPITFEQQVGYYNWPDSVTYLKFIANTEYFDVTPLLLPGLPSPVSMKKRGAGRRPPESNPDAHDWTTRLITMRMPNPYYKEKG